MHSSNFLRSYLSDKYDQPKLFYDQTNVLFTVTLIKKYNEIYKMNYIFLSQELNHTNGNALLLILM